VGETRVDLQHLLEDLRDAYSGPIEESIVTEVVANALDAGAATIHIAIDPAASTFAIVDDGRGMKRRELARYHDIAATTKRRGEGIGFAGVGIKLGLLVSREVLTETRRGRTHVASSWALTSRSRAPWKWVPPCGLVTERGTAIRLTVANPLSPLLDAGFVEEMVRRHFEPLLDPTFQPILSRHYPRGVAIAVDGRPLRPVGPPPAETVPLAIRTARRRKPSAVGHVSRFQTPLPADRAGVAVSTFGKVIKRGWDWLGLSPSTPDSITGLVEAPDLAACLTLNKNDFLRAGPRGATYLAYRKALQEALSRQLAEWGDVRAEGLPPPRPARLDRDLERVLEDLSEHFPLLHSLVERRSGGQKRLPVPDGRGEESPGLVLSTTPGLGGEKENPETPGETAPPPQPGARDATPPEAWPAPDGALPAPGTKRRRAQYGLSLQFESRPDDHELGRLVDDTIWVNDRHPAFLRAQTSRSLGYHLALAVALALAPLAAAPSEEHLFVTRFLAEWGHVSASHAERGTRRGARPRRRRARGPGPAR
jgi:hypothetical protein